MNTHVIAHYNMTDGYSKRSQLKGAGYHDRTRLGNKDGHVMTLPVPIKPEYRPNINTTSPTIVPVELWSSKGLSNKMSLNCYESNSMLRSIFASVIDCLF